MPLIISLASIINNYRLLKMQVGYNCPYSDDDKINTDYVIEYPGKNHYDDAKNKRDNSPQQTCRLPHN